MSDSSLRDFNPFTTHSFTAVSTPPSADGAYQGGVVSHNKILAGASLPSPPPSPSHKPIGYASESKESTIPIPGLRLGPTSSYNDHVARAMNAPPQSILAPPNLPAPSWPDVNGLSSASTLPLSASSSSSSSSSSSASSSQSQSPSPYYYPYPHATGRPSPTQLAPPTAAGTHVFTDFRAEVERYRNAQTLGESDDLPVFKKNRDRTYAGF